MGVPELSAAAAPPGAAASAEAFFAGTPIVGMVHLGPLPGSARDAGRLDEVIARAEADAAALQAGGVDAVMVENYSDAPFHRAGVPPHTVAAITAAVSAVRRTVNLPVGVNVLRNDVCAAIAIAHVCGCRFVRCNVYVGAAVTDPGDHRGRGARGAGVPSAPARRRLDLGGCRRQARLVARQRIGGG